MPDINWYDKGRADRRAGLPRVAAPNDGREGEAWRQGWDAEHAEQGDDDDGATLEMAPVAILLHDGRLHLVDAKGRVLGVQSYVSLETSENGHDAIVRFVGVKIATA